ncbi:MAG: hypothetical protein COB36_11050 [Alphaproteobacteria bacterium]|nr:MAG: hypothetical protein COB36_11050 [Alphaproteobacteria bacterium]
MCFETIEDFGRSVTGGGLPIPASKPTPDVQTSAVSGNQTSILGGLWDSALGVFKQVGHIELERYETKRLTDLRQEENKARAYRDGTLAGTVQQYLGYADDPKTKNTAFIIGGVMVTIGLFLLVKRT